MLCPSGNHSNFESLDIPLGCFHPRVRGVKSSPPAKVPTHSHIYIASRNVYKHINKGHWWDDTCVWHKYCSTIHWPVYVILSSRKNGISLIEDSPIQTCSSKQSDKGYKELFGRTTWLESGSFCARQFAMI